MPQDKEKIVRVAHEIERYLLTHPQAADTLEGVVKWWLARQRFEESLTTVREALDYMVAQAAVSKSVNPDGTCVYQSTKKKKSPQPPAAEEEDE